MKYISVALVFILALMLELWFAPGGMRGDFVIATLIVFAFLLEFWELVVFILFGIFLLNSSFHPDVAMLLLALVPLATYAARRRYSLNPWLGVPVGIILGIAVFYAVVAPAMAFHTAGFLLVDIIVCVLFGELILCGAEGWLRG